MKNNITLILLFLSCIQVNAQDTITTYNFDCLIREVNGDLNQDGILDSVVICMDTIDITRPFQLQVFFGKAKGTFELIYSSNEIIEAMYPAELNGKYSGNQIPDVYIIDGILRIDFYIKGHASYDFKYQNKQFELIHFGLVYWDGKNITNTVFDLLTGKYTKQIQVLETKDVLVNIEKNVQLNPLPQLKNFMPFENELF